MSLARQVLTPCVVALRRLRQRRLQTAVISLAFTGAGVVLGSSSVGAALTHEASIRTRLGELPPADRAVQVRFRAQTADDARRLDGLTETSLQRFAALLEGRLRVRVWDPIAPADERGIRLVTVGRPDQMVSVTSGRLPVGCRGRTCEALALHPALQVGEEVPLGQRVRARIVGFGSLVPRALPKPFELAGRTLLIRSDAGPLGSLLAETPSLGYTMAPLRPDAIHGYQLGSLTELLRQTTVRLERADAAIAASAPLPLLDELARSGRVTRQRLLLVAGQGAALLLAFAAFAATTRRDDLLVLDAQLTTLSASHAQLALARALEVALPAVLGGVLAFAIIGGAATLVAVSDGLPAAFIAAALPLQTTLAVTAFTLLGAAMLFTSLRPPSRSRLGIGPLELAAMTALLVIGWEAATTGALDPDHIAGGGNLDPVLLLLPALAVFAGGVLLLRLLPLGFRLAERLARRGRIGVRLALLSAARNPRQASAATTFLAVALGSALFGLDYQATLDRQARDAAAFAVGGTWQVVERGELGSRDVSPLTRFERVSREPPTPVLRHTATIRQTGHPLDAGQVEVLGVPAEHLPQVLGWRPGFTNVNRAELAGRLHPQPIALGGAMVAQDVTALRLWARARTEVARTAVLHFLLPGQRFQRLQFGEVANSWRLLRVDLPAGLRGARLIGAEFVAAEASAALRTFDRGVLDLGPVQQRRSGGWSTLTAFDSWTATSSGDFDGSLTEWVFKDAPVRQGARFKLNGTAQPLIRPALELPETLPALAGPAVATAAVDNLVTLDILGQTLKANVIEESTFFPTATTNPSGFLIIDYDTLFAFLNLDRPGIAPPTEAWFFRPQSPEFRASLQRPPFRVETAVALTELERRIRSDPLAAGTRRILTISALLAALLGLLGLVLGARSSLRDEERLAAEYEGLGVPPTTLARSMQYRLLLLCVAGVAAALLGAALAVRLTVAFVAVTGGAERPLPPIQPVIAWAAGTALLLGVAILTVLSTAVLTRSAYRRSPAQRMGA